MKSGHICAIITARGGSQGLPQKNLCLLAGKPLIAHTIAAALECPKISKCFVTTEDARIRRASLRAGAEVIDRPLSLATDRALSRDVVVHALETLKTRGALPEHFALLQPTSPLRTSKHLRKCLDLYFRSTAASMVSVTEAEHHPFKSYRLQNGLLKPLFGIEHLDQPRQALPRVYRENGAIYVLASHLFLRNKSFFIPPVMPYLMPMEDSIDIDSAVDLFLAEALLKRRRDRRSWLRWQTRRTHP